MHLPIVTACHVGHIVIYRLYKDAGNEQAGGCGDRFLEGPDIVVDVSNQVAGFCGENGFVSDGTWCPLLTVAFAKVGLWRVYGFRSAGGVQEI